MFNTSNYASRGAPPKIRDIVRLFHGQWRDVSASIGPSMAPSMLLFKQKLESIVTSVTILSFIQNHTPSCAHFLKRICGSFFPIITESFKTADFLNFSTHVFVYTKAKKLSYTNFMEINYAAWPTPSFLVKGSRFVISPTYIIIGSTVFV